MLSILVVDDEIDRLRTLAAFLRSTKHQVITASDGAVALEILNSLTFQVILCDAGLPRVAGLEVWREAKRRFSNADVFLMTEDLHFNGVAEMKDGAAGYFRRPFLLPELLHRVEQIAHAREVETKVEIARKWSDDTIDSMVLGLEQSPDAPEGPTSETRPAALSSRP